MAWFAAERDSHHGFLEGLAIHSFCNSCLSTCHDDKHGAGPWDTLASQLDAGLAFAGSHCVGRGGGCL